MYHCIIVSWYHNIIISFYDCIILSLYRSIALSFYHSTILSFYHSAFLPFYHATILPFYHSHVWRGWCRLHRRESRRQISRTVWTCWSRWRMVRPLFEMKKKEKKGKATSHGWSSRLVTREGYRQELCAKTCGSEWARFTPPQRSVQRCQCQLPYTDSTICEGMLTWLDSSVADQSKLSCCCYLFGDIVFVENTHVSLGIACDFYTPSSACKLFAQTMRQGEKKVSQYHVCLSNRSERDSVLGTQTPPLSRVWELHDQRQREPGLTVRYHIKRISPHTKH